MHGIGLAGLRIPLGRGKPSRDVVPLATELPQLLPEPLEDRGLRIQTRLERVPLLLKPSCLFQCGIQGERLTGKGVPLAGAAQEVVPELPGDAVKGLELLLEPIALFRQLPAGTLEALGLLPEGVQLRSEVFGSLFSSLPALPGLAQVLCELSESLPKPPCLLSRLLGFLVGKNRNSCQ